VRFRSPRPRSSWVTSLLAVLDSAALYLALSPQSAPAVPARLCLRSGFLCLRQIAQAMGFPIPDEPDPDTGITLSYQEFLDAVARLQKVGSPSSATPPRHGRTSSAGGPTTSWLPTPWPTPSMPYRRCGRASAADPRRLWRRSAARPGQVINAEPPQTGQRRSRLLVF
jgi:hypothetical protein